ncbi:MAG: hypothetical protein ACP5QK_13230 [Myxococcota bacterium]
MPKSGEWVSYYIYSGKERMDLKLAIVGEKRLGEKDLMWFEIVTRTGELDFILKRLIEGDPLNPKKVYRQIVKIVNKNRSDYSPAIEIPAGDSNKADETLKSFPCLEDLGEKKLYKHNKKEFNAYIIKNDTPRQSLIVYSKEIPFFGIIKMESENVKIELIDLGNNATSEITEEPLKIIDTNEENE